MGEAKRRKLAAKRPPSQWDDPKQRAGLIALAHNAMAQSDDSTLSGLTLILPSGETIYLAADAAKKPPSA